MRKLALCGILVLALAGCAGLSFQGTTQEVGTENMESLFYAGPPAQVLSALAKAGASVEALTALAAAQYEHAAEYHVTITQSSGDAAVDGELRAAFRIWLAKQMGTSIPTDEEGADDAADSGDDAVK